MRLRIILIVLSLLAFLSASVAGYIYYSSLVGASYREAERDTALQAERIRNNLASFLSENLRTVKALAGLGAFREALERPEGPALAKANALLDHFRDALQADVCYLMDRKGDTLASSNRDAPDSFVGENFSFRPYWRQAIGGVPSTYMALGVTSNLRGVYYSHPVFGRRGKALGVVVIKAPIGRIEEPFRQASEGVVLLVDPDGIIFASNRPGWLFRTLRPLSPEDAARIARSQQFGRGPWEWSGLSADGGSSVRDGSGSRFLTYRMKVDAYPGWSVMYLRGLDEVSRRLSGLLLRVGGPIVLALCFLVGLAVLFLYKRASDDIVRRREAEEALEGARAQLARHSQELERQVRERTREITSILRHTPAVVYVKDREGRYAYVNSRFKELFGLRGRSLRGKTDPEIFPEELAHRFRAADARALAGEGPCQVEESVPLPGGVRVYLSTKFPIYNEEGESVAMCGISMDITEIRRAQDQLRRLSDSIIAGQEKERAAVSRELHDELGQLLTALRLDAAWLRERLKSSDPGASGRARAMCDIIDGAIEEVRGMATRLRPGALDRLGLVEALEWYAGDFEKRTGIACLFRHEGAFRADDKVATAAYRIAQESLTNVARHAGASRVGISLEVQDGAMTLLVEDDGRGFDLGALPESGGLGLAGMRERASLAGGTLTVESRPGGGTRVLLRIPTEGEALH